jgi:DHA3 family macrolide efflux protein-like MFS transporter
MTQRTAPRKIRAFTIICLGQLVSVLGSGLTGFALGVWVYQTTGSVSKYALITLSGLLPVVIVSPLAGALVDRWNRRFVIIVSDSGAAISTLAIALLLLTDRLGIWHIYLATLVNSTLSTFQRPALSAATTMLVPKEQLGRANGVIQAIQASGQLISPVVAGVLVGIIQVYGVILIDFATFLFAVTTLSFVRIPSPEPTADGEEKSSLAHKAIHGWRYVVSRPGLLGLVVFFAIGNFFLGFVPVLATPMILAFASPTVLGSLMSVSGSGMLVGSLLMSVWGGPKRRIYGVYAFEILCGLGVILAGLRPSPPLIAIGAFLVLFGLPGMSSLVNTILQSKVASGVQGRVFALLQMITGATSPISVLTSGPLADHIFEPLLAVDGPLAGNVGQLIGTGPGRGIGLFFIVLGFLFWMTTIAGYFYPRVRLLEDELPDAVPDEASVEAESKA